MAPAGARWDDGLAEFVLPYELVRTADDPDALLLAFLQTTYEAAATPPRGGTATPLERPNGARRTMAEACAARTCLEAFQEFAQR